MRTLGSATHDRSQHVLVEQVRDYHRGLQRDRPAVAPGIIKTPIHGRTEEQFEELNGMQPIGRVGEVDDVFDAVLYLGDADFVTGVVLPVDGGVHAGGQ